MHETLRRSSLGARSSPARAVNLELPLRAATASAATSCRATSTASARSPRSREDGFARVCSRRAAGAAALRRREGLDRGRRRVASPWRAVDDERLASSLIPETLERTTLGAAAAGRTVNLEVDVLAKYVEKLTVAR